MYLVVMVVCAKVLKCKYVSWPKRLSYTLFDLSPLSFSSHSELRYYRERV